MSYYHLKLRERYCHILLYKYKYSCRATAILADELMPYIAVCDSIYILIKKTAYCLVFIVEVNVHHILFNVTISQRSL